MTPSNVRRYEVDGSEVYLHGPEGDLYETVGTTDNPRAMIVHEGPLVYEGSLVRVEVEDSLIAVYHPHAGKEQYLDPRDRSTTAVKLQRLTERALDAATETGGSAGASAD